MKPTVGSIDRLVRIIAGLTLITISALDKIADIEGKYWLTYAYDFT